MTPERIAELRNSKDDLFRQAWKEVREEAKRLIETIGNFDRYQETPGGALFGLRANIHCTSLHTLADDYSASRIDFIAYENLARFRQTFATVLDIFGEMDGLVEIIPGLEPAYVNRGIIQCPKR